VHDTPVGQQRAGDPAVVAAQLPDRPAAAGIAAAGRYLQEHATENVTLEALGRHAGLSAFQLCRVFRQTVEMTPHAYQAQGRVRHAKSPLLRAGLPITTVAARAGFCDQAHLTRHFKRIVGLTPGRYLRDGIT
jgi:transcriptional regulator GlxA family with amidase domain